YVPEGFSSAVHRAVGRAGRVLRRMGYRAVPVGARADLRRVLRALARTRHRAGVLRRGVSAESEAAMTRTRRAALITALAVAVPRAALACPVCFGQNDSPLAAAMNQGILL